MTGEVRQERRTRSSWLWSLLALIMIVAAVQACSWLATLRLVPETVNASGQSRLQADYSPWESAPLLDIDLPRLATAAALGDEVVWDGGPAQAGGAAGGGQSSGSSDGGSGSTGSSGSSSGSGSSPGSGSSGSSGSSGQSGGSSSTGPGASSSNPTPTALGSASSTPTTAASSTPVPTATTITASNTPVPSNTPLPSNTPVPPPSNTPVPPPTNTPVPPPTDTPVPANGPPNAQDDSISTSSGAPTGIFVLGNDSDPDNNLDPDSVTVISGPSNGTILNIQPTTGEIRYRSNGGFTGVDSFTYQVCDFGGLCDTATVTISVN